MSTSARVGLLILLFAGVLVGLNGSSIPPFPPGNPDSLQIKVDDYAPQLVVTVTDTPLVRQLYRTLYALPPLTQQWCYLDSGPHYTLIFLQRTSPLVTALAKQEGCDPVTFPGEWQGRQATDAFWTELDTAVLEASPPAHPVALALQYAPLPNRASQTGQVPGEETTQRLYQAILALPRLPWNTSCSRERLPDFQLAFQDTDQAIIPAALYTACNSLALGPLYYTRGGWYTLTDSFKHLLAQVVASSGLTPAQPDQMELRINFPDGVEAFWWVQDAPLMQRLYQKVFTLRPTRSQPGCPAPADQPTRTVKQYTFDFYQWHLPLLEVVASQGCCTSIAVAGTSQLLQGDQEFWDLVSQAAKTW